MNDTGQRKFGRYGRRIEEMEFPRQGDEYVLDALNPVLQTAIKCTSSDDRKMYGE